jgi:organic hydroperoxide reductase OsmC/OhrA
MIHYPLKYEIRAKAGPGIRNLWESQHASLPNIACSIPTEFGGPGGGYTPEDFFALALLNCQIALFKICCEKRKLSYGGLEAKAITSLDMDRTSGQFFISEIEIFFDIKDASNPEAVKAAMESALKGCPIGNSIKTGKTYHVKVS